MNKQAFIALYDEFRDAELNKEYYARRIELARKKLRRLDIFLALVATGSGAAGFALWNVSFFGFQVGQWALGVLIGIAAVLAIAKPYLKLEDELERLSGVQNTYAALAHSLKDVVTDVKTDQAIREPLHANYKMLRQIRGSLGVKEDAPADSLLVDELQDRVNRRYPQSFFWYPDE